MTQSLHTILRLDGCESSHSPVGLGSGCAGVLWRVIGWRGQRGHELIEIQGLVEHGTMGGQAGWAGRRCPLWKELEDALGTTAGGAPSLQTHAASVPPASPEQAEGILRPSCRPDSDPPQATSPLPFSGPPPLVCRRPCILMSLLFLRHSPLLLFSDPHNPQGSSQTKQPPPNSPSCVCLPKPHDGLGQDPPASSQSQFFTHYPRVLAT